LRLIATALLPVVVATGLAPAAIAGTYAPGISGIYDAGNDAAGSLYCIPTADLLSKIPLLGDIDRVLEGNKQVVGVNLVRYSDATMYRQVEGRYTVVVNGGALRARGNISGSLDSSGGFAKSTEFRMRDQETFANADFVGRRFSDKGYVSFVPAPGATVVGSQPVIETECLLARDVDQLDSQQQSQVIDALLTFFSFLAGRGRVRVRI
jgi:hypothetical protein